MDRRISYKIVLDTETCPLDKTLAEVTPNNMWAYDLGWAVVDKRGNVYKTASYLISDIFCDEKELMKSAYYARKIPQYWEDVRKGSRKVVSLYTARKELLSDIKEYNVSEIYAHNMRFDYGVLNNTIRWTTKSKVRYFFPYGLKICDTLKMSRDVIGIQKAYKNFCAENGYLTATGQPRFTAEILYRYITKDCYFTESHTALEDVMIEKDILAHCFRQHKKMRKLLYEKAVA